MSFLSILLFSTAFYFAYGRPDAGPVPESDPPLVSSDYKIDSFIQEISVAIDKYMSPMSGIDEDTQNQVKSMLLDAIASYMNYAIITMKQNQTDDGTENGISRLLSGQDDIQINFESLPPFEENSGLIPVFHHSSITETKVEEVEDGEGYENKSSSMAEVEAT